MPSTNWFAVPDMVGGWRTPHQNQNGNWYQLDHSDHNNPIVHPTPLQIGGPYQQTWVMGMVPVGYDNSPINYDGMLIFDLADGVTTGYVTRSKFILDKSRLDSGDVLG